ncbi:redoxin family protein [bacterium]|nr:redoxin family protein [bacterium]
MLMTFRNTGFGMVAVLIAIGCGTPQKEGSNRFETRTHRAVLHINDSLDLPFEVAWETGADTALLVINGKERIRVEELRTEGDTLVVYMPVFPTYFRLGPSESGWEGHWYDPDRGADYRIPVSFQTDVFRRFPGGAEPSFSLNHRWAVAFYPQGAKPGKGLGEFRQDSGVVQGSILTESGDYRYLTGVLDGDRLELSTFDGTHAYLFRAHIRATDLIEGHFYSGNHHSKPFEARRDDGFELGNPDSLSQVMADGFAFAFPRLDGTVMDQSDAQLEGKVRIVQILGSWCPNCMDETRFFNELHQRYSNQGLEIVGIAFERSEELSKAKPALEKMIRDLKVPYPVLFAGSTAQIGEKLPQIQPFRGYPTSVFIDAQGRIRKVHAGFSGPGTSRYADYVQSTDALVRQLLSEIPSPAP